MEKKHHDGEIHFVFAMECFAKGTCPPGKGLVVIGVFLMAERVPDWFRMTEWDVRGEHGATRTGWRDQSEKSNDIFTRMNKWADAEADFVFDFEAGIVVRGSTPMICFMFKYCDRGIHTAKSEKISGRILCAGGCT